MKQQFIKTQDEETANKLTLAGFQLIDNSNGIWTFINDSKIKFSFDNLKITYSNKLCI